ncbi:hypothetical protein GT755_07705 [Herbidospora sp. NEAU-GS84]|uniref:DUF4760 domain-containing protein n=1 Tax=Herbidospora solisilvae TaxID=2696284 RepID=A0A7C9MZT9_9ACTN|nr:hypothetical protein [Herbidospora solisilvae]NAS21569.1 hypothetical protein [Herbidospora solisilvae]
MSAQEFAALAGIIQALAVIPTVAIGAYALLRDSRDRRIDRVLSFHQELMSGEIGAARNRLGTHLRNLGVEGRPLQIKRLDLLKDSKLGRYIDHEEAGPFSDATLLLRYFERANAARSAQSIYAPLFVELVGRHAAWWDMVFEDEGDRVPRAPLAELAAWSNQYAAKKRNVYPYLRNWGTNRTEDFPNS